MSTRRNEEIEKNLIKSFNILLTKRNISDCNDLHVSIVVSYRIFSPRFFVSSYIYTVLLNQAILILVRGESG